VPINTSQPLALCHSNLIALGAQAGRSVLLTVALALACVILTSVATADPPPTKDVVKIENPKALGVKQLTVERIPIGLPEDYKPQLIKLADGQLLLTGFYVPNQGGAPAEYCFLYRSSDGGRTWSDRQQLDILGREPYLSMISDGTLFISTHVLPNARGNNDGYTFAYLYRSTDAGRMWQGTKIPFDDAMRNARQDGQRPQTAGIGPGRNVLELDDGTAVFGVGSGHGAAFLWRSKDGGQTWDKSLTGSYTGPDVAKYPYSIHNEVFLWQADNGDILSVKRVASKFYPPISGTQIPQATSDQYERMVLYRSKDGGRNWSYEELGSHYAEMYPSILRLQDGRLLFTFTMRTAVEPNVLPLGLRAVIGVETRDGFAFDFRHDRIMLDTKTPANLTSGGGFGNTVQLADGTLVTTCSYRVPVNTTRCEVIRWRAPGGRR